VALSYSQGIRDRRLVQRLAGHTEISTAMQYVHLNDDDVRAAMAKEREEKGGHTSRHTKQDATAGAPN
jgi:integrase